MYYLYTGLVHILVGFAVALVHYVILGRKSFGGVWFALVVGVIGAFCGTLFVSLFGDLINMLLHLGGTVNVLPPIIAAGVLLSILWTVSRGRRGETDE